MVEPEFGVLGGGVLRVTHTWNKNYIYCAFTNNTVLWKLSAIGILQLLIILNHKISIGRGVWGNV